MLLQKGQDRFRIGSNPLIKTEELSSVTIAALELKEEKYKIANNK